jgi:hypothetical protein
MNATETYTSHRYSKAPDYEVRHYPGSHYLHLHDRSGGLDPSTGDFPEIDVRSGDFEAPALIDPDGMANEWLKELADQ